MAQLAALQAKMTQASSGASAAGATASTPTGYTFTSYLRPGSEGDEVTQLQKTLVKLGFLATEPTGYYGAKTVDAVVALQKAHGLKQLGVVGPATREILNSLSLSSESSSPSSSTTKTSTSYVFENFIGPGQDGTDVLELQNKLTALGYLTVKPNGHFGPSTEAAVKKFQTDHNIRAAGYVGPSTRDALNSAQ
jgi:peptidoglycan hydrolase-like protein with peptidoglycan-binding domain